MIPIRTALLLKIKLYIKYKPTCTCKISNKQYMYMYIVPYTCSTYISLIINFTNFMDDYNLRN